MDDQRVRDFSPTILLEQLEKVGLARLAGQRLDLLTADRHQDLLDSLLRKLAAVLNDASARIAEVIATEVHYLRFAGLDSAAGRYATTKIVSGITRIVAEMADDPVSFIARLKEEREVRAKFECVQAPLLASPALSGYLQGLCGNVVARIRTDLANPDSVLRERTIAGIQRVGEKLQADIEMQEWINTQLTTTAPRWVERYREDIRRYIIARAESR
jgi:uncharacterized membrane-anchored protein YjiN (DUF445 family)